ncbi:MAG TPA: dihydroneopterin aldolase [Anaerolineaceae bacterium]
MDQIFITNILARGVIGISDREREHPQDILVNITLFSDIGAVSQSDRLEDTIDYSKVAKQVLGYVEKSKRYTVEALASDLANQLLADYPIQGARIRVEKPGAVRFTSSVGVEIERFRA